MVTKPNPLMNIGALTQEEGSYLLGLYSADGSLPKSSKRSYIVVFAFQGNEGEIVDRVVELFRRANLKPYVHRRHNYIVAYSISTNLNKFFPSKKALLRNKETRMKFFQDNNLLLSLESRLAFCAGLLDGDGSCKAYQYEREKKSRFKSISIQWHFSQHKYPFLIPLFQELVEFLVLMDREVIERVKRDRGMRLQDAPKMLRLSRKALDTYYRRGRLRATLVDEGFGKCLVIPREEVEELKKVHQPRKGVKEEERGDKEDGE